MPIVFLLIGVAVIALGVRGTAQDAGALLASEFTGANSFVPWFLSIMILGLIGYYKPARPVADAMLGLVVVVLLLAKGSPNAAGGGFFAQLNAAFAQAKPTAATTAGAQAVSNPSNTTAGAAAQLIPTAIASTAPVLTSGAFAI